MLRVYSPWWSALCAIYFKSYLPGINSFVFHLVRYFVVINIFRNLEGESYRDRTAMDYIYHRPLLLFILVFCFLFSFSFFFAAMAIGPLCDTSQYTSTYCGNSTGYFLLNHFGDYPPGGNNALHLRVERLSFHGLQSSFGD